MFENSANFGLFLELKVKDFMRAKNIGQNVRKNFI
jgi:hypothetical protein